MQSFWAKKDRIEMDRIEMVREEKRVWYLSLSGWK